MNIEDLQLVNRTPTADIILKHLVNRERNGAETALYAFRSYLIREGNEINFNDFVKLFSDLEEAGVGEFKEYQNDKRGKFIWYYSLKNVSEQILHPNKKIDIKAIDQIEAPKPRGRPVGYSPKLKAIVDKPKVLQRTRRPRLPGLVFLFTSDSGEKIPLKLSEAERLINEVNLIKSKLG